MLARTTPIIQAVSYILVRGRIFALERRVRTLYLALYPSRRCAHAGGGFSQNFLKGPSRAGTGSSVNRLLSFLSLSLSRSFSAVATAVGSKYRQCSNPLVYAHRETLTGSFTVHRRAALFQSLTCSPLQERGRRAERGDRELAPLTLDPLSLSLSLARSLFLYGLPPVWAHTVSVLRVDHTAMVESF